ncbi:hypothetical protein [Roseateles sp. BYS87W]|uniref:Uncharacterized protein n=1 Tax=Pelomonas baiyunensis TaxID=3299026 RepID=A0ABW7GSY6_9BURK
MDPTALAEPPLPCAAPARVRVCVIGTADALQASASDLTVLAADDRVRRLDWRLDDGFGEPPVEADWADGLIVLNSDAWAAPRACARLQSLLKMAWRCGRTVALCGEALQSLGTLGFPADVPAEAEGLFLCPQRPCAGTLREFLDAVQDQPHTRR